jgi:uncharacterized protein (TIGR02271 family)
VTQTIVAVYDTPAHAELAVQDMLAAGVPEAAIERHAPEGTYAGTAVSPVARSTEGQGFWSGLFGGEPDHDTTVYDRSVSGGSNAVSVKIPDEHVTRVTEILESHHPIDIDDRAGSFGLTQSSSTRTAAADLATAASRDVKAAPGMAKARTGDETLQLSEETLNVGKRVVNRGTTRIRRFVVETPVEEQVSLRDEHVSIERRPVTDGRAVGGNMFTDQVIEMTETGEEAVASKTARVREEVSIRKEASDRVETVRDTVRREDVEIVKVAGDGATSTTTNNTTRAPKI